MGAIFVDRHQAAELLGIGYRTFERKYVETGKIEILRFPVYGAPAKHLYRRADVEKLKSAKMALTG